jgi:hypothetical protein
MATGYALLKDRTDDRAVYQVPAESQRDRPRPAVTCLALLKFSGHSAFAVHSSLRTACGHYVIHVVARSLH